MSKMIKKGNVALCSACNKLNAAALDCECTIGMANQAARNKFRKTFPRHEHDVAALVAENVRLKAYVDATRAVCDGDDWSVNTMRQYLATLDAGPSK